MEGHRHDRIRRIAGGMLAAGFLVALLPNAVSAAGTGADGLPRCGPGGSGTESDALVVEPWRVVLDTEGAVAEHRMTLRRLGRDTTLSAGRRSFALAIRPGRVLIGERDGEGTRLDMVDTGRVCRVWSRRLERLAYAPRLSTDGTGLQMALYESVTRLFEGTLVIDVEQGTTEAMIDGECAEGCAPSDGEIPVAAYEPAGVARPVPNFGAGGWPKDRTLGFRWAAGAIPPAWAKGPLGYAANDAARSSHARSPRFVYRSSAANSVRYSGTFPTFCGNGIACASRAMPTTWGVWIRPHDTDFAWGTLRWCQKRSSSGCFDIRRVMLHELGHIAGLHHPSSSGAGLGAHESVMHAITPNTPKPGSTRHSFGRCDVATLQELYDVPNNRAAISTCNDVATNLTLTIDQTSVTRGTSVKLTAALRVKDWNAYRELAGNPLNSRSVKLKYRRAGSSDTWSTAWMKAINKSGRHELTIAPQATWEFKAVFPAPDDEGLRFSRSPLLKVKVNR
jgi:hypothetical protein